MKKIFFTGVTGFMGQFLAVKMLEKGYQILFLVRSSKHISAEDRVVQALNFVDEDASEKYANQYSVVVGDVTWSNFGIKDLCIFSDVEEIWHIAGAVTFSESGRDATFKINLDGAKNMIALAEKINVQSVHYCSTAYVRQPGCNHVVENRASLNHEDGYNPYERSKNFAERIVQKWRIANPKKQVVIYRPGIIAGDSKSGKVAGFTGYYRFMEPFYVFANKFQGKKVNVPGKNGATVNLVTIDWVVDTIMRLQKCKCQGVYNLTNDSPPEYTWLLEKGLEILGVKGPVCGSGVSSDDPQTKRLENLLRRGLRDYVPYISEDVKFSQEHLRETLGAQFAEHPQFDEALLKIMLDYAIEQNFGR